MAKHLWREPQIIKFKNYFHIWINIDYICERTLSTMSRVTLPCASYRLQFTIELYNELWRAEKSYLSMRKLRCSEGSGMLKDDPLGEGSNAGSTNHELWRAGDSILRMRGNSAAQKGAACSYGWPSG